MQIAELCCNELVEQFVEAKANSEILAGFIRQFEKVGAEATEFSEEAWGGLIDHMTVYAKDNIEVTFIGGFSVTVG